jgi:hypothetical protein
MAHPPFCPGRGLILVYVYASPCYNEVILYWSRGNTTAEAIYDRRLQEIINICKKQRPRAIVLAAYWMRSRCLHGAAQEISDVYVISDIS